MRWLLAVRAEVLVADNARRVQQPCTLIAEREIPQGEGACLVLQHQVGPAGKEQLPPVDADRVARH